jgi:type I restriction enzyme S subunit
MSDLNVPSFKGYLLAELAAPGGDTFVDGPFGSSLKSHEYVASGVRLIQLQNIGDGNWRDENRKFITSRKYNSLARHGALPGDIAIAKMADPVARACIVPPVAEQFVVVADCIRLRVDTSRFDSGYVVRAINSPYTRREAEKKAIGSTRVRINLSVLKTVGCLAPELSEQKTISKVLDTLDTAIHETESIIAKLKAIKQGLLHDLLTRGIDGNGELRPAQFEAPQRYKPSPLGLIPKEWDVVTLESISNTVTSGSRDWARFYADSGALFVRIGNLTREHINFRYESTNYVRPPRNADGQRTRLEPGDILVSITADLGIVGVVPEGVGEAYINQHIALIRPDLNTVNSRFIGHYLAGPIAQTYISKLNDAGAKAGLNLPTIRGLLSVVPSRAEQDMIAVRLDEVDKRIQNAITEAAKLSELKAGLTDDLLTGRVRVTDVLARLTGKHSINPHSLLSELCQALYQADQQAKDEYKRELFGDAFIPELLLMRKDKVRVEIRKENVSHNAPHMHISHSDKFDASISLKDFSVLAGDIDRKVLKHYLKTLAPLKAQLMQIWNDLNEKENSVAAEVLISNLKI